jgi:hypothetical protein
MGSIIRWSLQAAVFGIVGTIARAYILTGHLPQLPMIKP